MKSKRLIALSLASFPFVAFAADPIYFRLSELLASESVKDFSKPEVTLHLTARVTGTFVEPSRPETYTRSALSLSPFGGSKRHCVEAFEKSLKAMIEDAVARGYDAIIDIRAAVDGKPSTDPEGFSCKPGYKTTEVALVSTFAMTEAAARRAAEEEQRALNLPERPPAANSVLVPLDALLTSQEAKSLLGSSITAHWGTTVAAYSTRFGPDDYTEAADTKSIGQEEACKQAALKALQSMVEEAKSRNYDSLIRIRSHLNGEYAGGSVIECAVGKKAATVTLQASLANKR